MHPPGTPRYLARLVALVVGSLLLAACGGHHPASRSYGASNLVQTTHRDADPSDFDPVCREISGESFHGTYREFESGDTGAIVIAGTADPHDVQELVAAWSDIDACSDDDVEYRRWTGAPAGTTGWTAELGDRMTQYLVLAVEGDEVVIVASSGPDSASVAAALVDR